MRAVVQRTSHASVKVEGKIVGEIGRGLVVLLGVSGDDGKTDADYLVDKILQLRVFEDAENKMNLSLLDIQGELLVISQFTLYGDVRKGRRPSFAEAAAPDKAGNLYEYFVSEAARQLLRVETGKFRAMMDVELINEGPVTILLDSKKIF